MPIYDLRSISQVGTTEPFELQVARGQIPGHSIIHKFGANFDIDTGSTPESVWTGGGLYPWSAFSSADFLWLQSSDGDDQGQVDIQGLDASYHLLTETVQLSSEGAIDTQNKFIRVFRMTYSDENAGDITARIGSDTGTIVAKIDAGFAQTLMAVYTVPAGYSAFLLKGDLTINAFRDVQLKFFIRRFGSAFRIAHMAEVRGAYTYDFPFPQKIPEKSDLDIRIDDVNLNNSRATANFDLMLVKEQGPL